MRQLFGSLLIVLATGCSSGANPAGQGGSGDLSSPLQRGVYGGTLQCTGTSTGGAGEGQADGDIEAIILIGENGLPVLWGETEAFENQTTPDVFGESTGSSTVTERTFLPNGVRVVFEYRGQLNEGNGSVMATVTTEYLFAGADEIDLNTETTVVVESGDNSNTVESSCTGTVSSSN